MTGKVKMLDKDNGWSKIKTNRYRTFLIYYLISLSEIIKRYILQIIKKHDYKHKKTPPDFIQEAFSGSFCF